VIIDRRDGGLTKEAEIALDTAQRGEENVLYLLCLPACLFLRLMVLGAAIQCADVVYGSVQR
jgi:hypothetical protein